MKLTINQIVYALYEQENIIAEYGSMYCIVCQHNTNNLLSHQLALHYGTLHAC